MRLPNIRFACFAVFLAAVDASAPRLRKSQKCAMFKRECPADRSNAFLSTTMTRNWTELADIELINNRLRLVLPYVIIPNYSNESEDFWQKRSLGGSKPASAQEWIDKVRPEVEKAATFYEPTNVVFREYYQRDIDNGRFDNRQYIKISDFYDKGQSTGCSSDVGPAPFSNHIEVDIERCRTESGNGRDYHAGRIAHEFMHVQWGRDRCNTLGFRDMILPNIYQKS